MSANASLRRKLRFEEVCSDEEEVSPVIQEIAFSEEVTFLLFFFTFFYS